MSLYFTEPVTREEKDLIGGDGYPIFFYEVEKDKYECEYSKGYKYLLWPYSLLRVFDIEKYEEYVSYMSQVDIPPNWSQRLAKTRIELRLNTNNPLLKEFIAAVKSKK